MTVIDVQAVHRILSAVGARFIPEDLDLEALRDVLVAETLDFAETADDTAAWRARVKRMERIARLSRDLAAALSDGLGLQCVAGALAMSGDNPWLRDPRG